MTTEHSERSFGERTFEFEQADRLRQVNRTIQELIEKPELEEYEAVVLEFAQYSLAEAAEFVMIFKANAGNGVPDALPNFSVAQDGVTFFITTPPTTPEENPEIIPVPIEHINPDLQEKLPPISEELAIIGLREAEKEKRLSSYAMRHDDDERNWLRFQAATKNIAERVVAVIKAESLGQLTHLKVYVHEAADKISIYLPKEDNKDGYDIIVSEISVLEKIEPKLSFLLANII